MVKDLYNTDSPYWCWLKEEMLGEVSNRLNRIGDYELAEKYQPDIFSFTQEDVMQCTDIDDLPADWRKLADACIEKYNIKP
jgi:hypothetical protein